MNILLWILQVLFGIFYIYNGVMHFLVPPGSPPMMASLLANGLGPVAGIAEILGGTGLILPGLTRIQTRLTPLAGAGLALVMIGACAWHAQRGEFQIIPLPLVLGILVSFIAYGRWKLYPLPSRKAHSTEPD